PDPKPQLSANTEYVLCGLSNAVAGASPRIYYDNGGEIEGHYQDLASYNFPNPANFTHEARKYSIYCTYTPSGAPTMKTWTATLKTVHFLRRPFRVVKLTQTLNIAHIFLRRRFIRLNQALQTLHNWTVTIPSLILKQWFATLKTTHVLRRPKRRINYAEGLQTMHVFGRPARVIRLPATLQLTHIFKRPCRLIHLMEQLNLTHAYFVAFPSEKKTKLFLIIGDLSIQLSGD
ncbi:MAG: hypothetical protein QXH37_08030, partial [Candidatus Bathyarchaeia archaeon]